MKKTTVILISVVLVTMFTTSAWAHPAVRIDLGGNGFGFSVSNVHSGFATFSYNYRPYPYYYSRYYPNRPYLGWGGYRGHHHHGHKYWRHHHRGHHHKGLYYGNQRRFKRGDHGYRQGRHHRKGHHRPGWRPQRGR